MNKFLIKTPAGELTFLAKEEGAVLESYTGRDLRLTIPAVLEPADLKDQADPGLFKENGGGLPVTGIAPKAFFNNRFLQQLIVPAGVRSVGDWAFSHCPALRQVSFSRGRITLGKGLFEEDRKLRRILLLPPGEADAELLADIKGYGSLLAATATVLDAPYLLSCERTDDAAWLSMWDQRLITILESDDSEGFTELVLCGEEDYGSLENSPAEFFQKKRWRKVRLCFLRLLYDKGLAEDTAEKLRDYLRAHTKGCESEETWLFLKKERGDDMAYLKLFTELSCITEENFDACIADLSEEQPQMRAFLLRWQGEHLRRTSLSDRLSLDW